MNEKEAGVGPTALHEYWSLYLRNRQSNLVIELHAMSQLCRNFNYTTP